MIPNLFHKLQIPETIPEDLLDTIVELQQRSSDKEDFIKKCFLYIVSNWWWNRIQLFSHFSRIFQKNIHTIINSKWYMHCTTMNYILRIILVKSSLFSEKDIVLRCTHT